jgi:hypothetical protein
VPLQVVQTPGQPSPGDFTGSINGLQFGSGTSYRYVGMTGWHDIAPAPLGGSASLSPKAQRQGSWPLPYYVPERVVTLALAVEAAGTDFEAAVLSLASATVPQVDSNGLPVQVPLQLQLAGTTYTVYGSVSNRQIPMVAPDYATGYSLATVTLDCPDARKFGADVTAVTGLPSVSGGLTWPITFPVAWSGSQVSGSMTLTNPGDANGPVKLRIDGPVTAPAVTHLETGAALTLATNLTVNSGDWLDIDCEARTVLYNGQASRNGYLTSRGWFEFEPGANTFTFTSSGYNATAQLTATCTPAWI